MTLRTRAEHLMIYGDDDRHVGRLAERFVAENPARHAAQAAHAASDFPRILNRYTNLKQITVYTHGNVGYLHLAGGGITVHNVHVLTPHASLFESAGRVLFVGCNVAEGEAGMAFLVAAGRSLLRGRGGVAGAANSKSFFGRWGLIDFHLPRWGTLKLVQFDARGNVTDRQHVGPRFPFARR